MHTYIYIYICISSLVQCYLSATASFVFYGITCLIQLIEFARYFAALLNKKCVRQVVLDKQFPLSEVSVSKRGLRSAGMYISYTYIMIITYIIYIQHICIYIYIYIYIYTPSRSCVSPFAGSPLQSWLRTNGVNTNGAAAKVMILTDWGKRYAPALLGI